ncbi:(2Fe-2S)-binding protein (plasmid) [Agrobacterium deltaense]
MSPIVMAIQQGASGPNQIKAFLRAGMGPCQGRMCALAVSRLFAAEKSAGMEAVSSYRVRPPLKPISLSELARSSEAMEGLEEDGFPSNSNMKEMLHD